MPHFDMHGEADVQQPGRHLNIMSSDYRATRLPGYGLSGRPAVKALIRASKDTFWSLLLRHM